MAQSINTSYAVIALGDRETIGHFDLTERAARQGAVVNETYCFEPGEAASNDDLIAVEAVLTALSRALATHVDIWMPFPREDLGREQHLRRLSLVLQRHGLNLLMGHDLEPCTMDGGFSAIDFALRMEVKAVDELGFAALAMAATRTLGVEIEVELLQAAGYAAEPAHQEPVLQEPVQPREYEQRVYSTGEVAAFFGKSVQWVYSAMRSGVFTRPDGSPIKPLKAGKHGRWRFTLPMLQDMARACYRRGVIGEGELLDLLSVLECAEGE
ncbi:MAG: hypothetical protein KIH64_011825 [Mycobacterium sp.]|nr:hypothetical protein [Mycobacterium sp.]